MQAQASSSQTTAYDPPRGAGRWLVVCAQVCVIPDTAEFHTFHSPPKEIPWPFAIAPRAPCPSPPALGNPSPTSFRGRLLGPQRCPRIPVSDAQGEAGNVRVGSKSRAGAGPDPAVPSQRCVGVGHAPPTTGVPPSAAWPLPPHRFPDICPGAPLREPRARAGGGGSSRAGRAGKAGPRSGLCCLGWLSPAVAALTTSSRRPIRRWGPCSALPGGGFRP